jgi:hypothetical protein
MIARWPSESATIHLAASDASASGFTPGNNVSLPIGALVPVTRLEAVHHVQCYPRRFSRNQKKDFAMCSSLHGRYTAAETSRETLETTELFVSASHPFQRHRLLFHVRIRDINRHFRHDSAM